MDGLQKRDVAEGCEEQSGAKKRKAGEEEGTKPVLVVLPVRHRERCERARERLSD
jgi:hypothetical protein